MVVEKVGLLEAVHPVSPWGKPTKGMKTRHRKGADKLIVKKR